MTLRISLTQHEPAAPHPIVADVFEVGPGGVVGERPVCTYELPVGVTATIHLRPRSVLVVRESTEEGY